MAPAKRMEDFAGIPDLMFGDAARNARGQLIFHLRKHFKRVEASESNEALAEAIDKFRAQEQRPGDAP